MGGVLALAALAALAGCGSSGSPTRATGAATTSGGAGRASTTAASGASASGASRSTSTQASASQGSASASSASGGSEAPGSAAQGTAHKAPEPAFTESSARSAGTGLEEAEQTIAARGYSAGEPAQFHEHQTLQVLVGTRSGSTDGYGQQAFFFIDGRFLGTDTSEASATVKVLSQGETEVTLGYPLYRTGDALGSPSGGEATVRFQLDNGRLQALGAIPSASPSAALGRR